MDWGALDSVGQQKEQVEIGNEENEALQHLNQFCARINNNDPEEELHEDDALVILFKSNFFSTAVPSTKHSLNDLLISITMASDDVVIHIELHKDQREMEMEAEHVEVMPEYIGYEEEFEVEENKIREA